MTIITEDSDAARIISEVIQFNMRRIRLLESQLQQTQTALRTCKAERALERAQREAGDIP